MEGVAPAGTRSSTDHRGHDQSSWFIVGDRTGQFESPYRYVWPAEMDLMAELAGLTLRERWAHWDRSLFTNESTNTISVWERLK